MLGMLVQTCNLFGSWCSETLLVVLLAELAASCFALPGLGLFHMSFFVEFQLVFHLNRGFQRLRASRQPVC